MHKCSRITLLCIVNLYAFAQFCNEGYVLVDLIMFAMFYYCFPNVREDKQVLSDYWEVG